MSLKWIPILVPAVAAALLAIGCSAGSAPDVEKTAAPPAPTVETHGADHVRTEPKAVDRNRAGLITNTTQSVRGAQAEAEDAGAGD